MLRARAPAKVNLTLAVLGRRADGFHELDSLVAFAGCAADALTLEPGPTLALGSVEGPFATAAGEGEDNLVLKAARETAARIEGLVLGTFSLVKRIPVAAGLGGGSADAAAALRLIAQVNGLAADDPRLVEAAEATGSDVPVCLASRAARFTGRGEIIEPVAMDPIPAVLANPLKPVSTAEIFRVLALKPGDVFRGATAPIPSPLVGEGRVRGGGGALHIEQGRNDLEPPAIALLPDIADGLAALQNTQNCRLARMSGSGATVFGLYDDQRSARRAARALGESLPGWWVRATLLR